MIYSGEEFILTMIDGYCVVTKEQMEKILTRTDNFIALPDGQVKARHQITGFTPIDLYIKQDKERLSEKSRFRCAYGIVHSFQSGCCCQDEYCGSIENRKKINLLSPFVANYIKEVAIDELNKYKQLNSPDYNTLETI